MVLVTGSGGGVCGVGGREAGDAETPPGGPNLGRPSIENAVACDGGALPGGSSIVALAGELADVVARLVACPVADLVEPEASRVHGVLSRAVNTLGVVAAGVLGRVLADGRWATTPDGRSARDFEDYLTRTSRASRAGAKRQTRLAQTLQNEAVPGLAGAVSTGGVSLEHAHVLTRLGPTTPARRDALTSTDPQTNAAFLLARASEQGVEEFTREVKRWAATIDPDADERGHRTATAKTSCVLSDRDDGVTITGFMTPVDGAAFDTALRAVAGIPAVGDERTVEQRMGAALGDMARLVLDHGLAATSSGGQRPHLSVTITLESLIAQVQALADTTRAEAGARGGAAFPTIPPGWEAGVLADGTPIPASVLARLACDAEVTRVVFGPDSQVLDVGRAERLYTGALRRAVVARDRHCAYPGCTRPPKFGEIHHIRHWAAHGGETSITNGILVCWHHHDVVHTRHLTIRRNQARARWDFTEADGTPIPHPTDRHPELAGPPDGPPGPDRRNGRDGPDDRDGRSPRPRPGGGSATPRRAWDGALVDPDGRDGRAGRQGWDSQNRHDGRYGREPDRHPEPPHPGTGLPPDSSTPPKNPAEHGRRLPADRAAPPDRGPRDNPDRGPEPPPASLFDDLAQRSVNIERGGGGL